MFVVDNVFQFADEPRVNLGQFVDALDGITFFQRLCDGKDTQVGRIGQFVIQVRETGMVIAYEAVHALTNHTQSFLDNLFKRSSDGHDFAHRLHAGADAVGYAGKLVEVPARNLANQVIQLRSHIGRVRGTHLTDFIQCIAQRNLGGHESQRITGGLGSQCR